MGQRQHVGLQEASNELPLFARQGRSVSGPRTSHYIEAAVPGTTFSAKHDRTHKVTAAQSLHEAGQAKAECRVLALSLPLETPSGNDREVPVSANVAINSSARI
jgi:hypothetical protein